MTKPRYQPILKDKVPSVNLPIGSEEPLGNARIIAGELNGTKGVAKTFSPVQMWDVSLPHVGSEIDIPYPADHNCIIFVRRGRVSVLSGEDGDGKKSELGPQDVALMRLDGSDILRLRVDAADSSVLIMGGEPLNEPIRAQG
jgi:quercetin 2,3-dioxygenase